MRVLTLIRQHMYMLNVLWIAQRKSLDIRFDLKESGITSACRLRGAPCPDLWRVAQPKLITVLSALWPGRS